MTTSTNDPEDISGCNFNIKPPTTTYSSETSEVLMKGSLTSQLAVSLNAEGHLANLDLKQILKRHAFLNNSEMNTSQRGLDKDVELRTLFFPWQDSDTFLRAFGSLCRHWLGRPTPLYFAKRLSNEIGGGQIYLKREDLLNTGLHSCKCGTSWGGATLGVPGNRTLKGS